MGHKIFFAALLLLLTFVCTEAHAASATSKGQSDTRWTVQDSINAAITYNPSLKQEQESKRVAEENVRQAKAGYLPQVNVNAAGGGRTVLMQKR